MTTKTATIGAWLPAHNSLRPSELHETDGSQLIEALGYSTHDMTSAGWAKVGTAQITVELMPAEQCMHSTIAALRREQGELQAKATQIEAEIQKLLAITYAPAQAVEEAVL